MGRVTGKKEERIDRHADRHTDRSANWNVDRHTDRNADRAADRAEDRAADRQRGSAALLYVLLLTLVLSAAVPLILSLTSNASLSLQAARNEKLASGLAIGGMEALLAYLRAYPEEEEEEEDGVERDDYLAAYPGFGEKTFATPEGVPVKYSATLVTASQGRFIVRIKAEAGTGPARREKTIEYMFAPTGPERLEIVTDDSKRIEVPAGSGGFYVDWEGSVDSGSIVNGNPEKLEELADAIDATIGYYRNEADDVFNEDYQTYYPLAQDPVCPGNCISDADWETMAANLPDPPVLKIPAGNYWAAIDVTIGSPENPVVLFFDNRPTFNNLTLTVYGTVIFPQGMTTHGMNLTVYGDVIFGTGISPTSGFRVTTHKLNGEGGNFYVLGNFYPHSAPVLNIEGNFYADNVRLNNPSWISVGGKMIVGGELRFHNSMAQFDIGLDLIIGSLYTCCNNRLDSGGDILIEGNIQRTGTLEMNAGGNIGVGGTLAAAPWHPVIVQTGGGTTSLIIPKAPGGEDGGNGKGSGSGGGSWNPVRLS